jgi:hypothetical protein
MEAVLQAVERSRNGDVPPDFLTIGGLVAPRAGERG